MQKTCIFTFQQAEYVFSLFIIGWTLIFSAHNANSRAYFFEKYSNPIIYTFKASPALYRSEIDGFRNPVKKSRLIPLQICD